MLLHTLLIEHKGMLCLKCEFETPNQKFCSRSCAASFNNRAAPKRKPEGCCATCATPVKTGWKYCAACYEKKQEKLPKVCTICLVSFSGVNKFCSKSCLKQAQQNRSPAKQALAAHLLKNYNTYISLWLAGEEAGGSSKGQLSYHVRRYIFAKFEGKCCKCGWCEINPTTGKVPLQVDHIDGDWTNNAESNLQLLCPNCHALTPTYGSLNRGAGRPYKRDLRRAEVTILNAF